MPTWPSTLPQKPLVEGYAETFQSGQVRSEMDTGPPKVRRRFTATVNRFEMSFMMDSTQLDTLESFYETDLEGGVLQFDFPDPRGTGTKLLRFRERYTTSPRGSLFFTVACPFEELP